MDALGHYDSVEEISNAILDGIKEKKNLRISSMNAKCANENQLFDVMNALKKAGEIDYDETFIFAP